MARKTTVGNLIQWDTFQDSDGILFRVWEQNGEDTVAIRVSDGATVRFSDPDEEVSRVLFFKRRTWIEAEDLGCGDIFAWEGRTWLCTNDKDMPFAIGLGHDSVARWPDDTNKDVRHVAIIEVDDTVTLLRSADIEYKDIE